MFSSIDANSIAQFFLAIFILFYYLASGGNLFYMRSGTFLQLDFFFILYVYLSLHFYSNYSHKLH